MRVLDAGCGSRLHADTLADLLPDCDRHVVGIDVSEAALDLNSAIDEKIVGDVQTFRLPPASFDLVICQDVLEHLPKPYDALENIVAAVRPGGWVFIRVPHVLSPKALITKFTPLRLHILIYRHYFEWESAGEPGRGPFKTYLRFGLRPSVLSRYAAEHGMEVERIEEVETQGAQMWDRHPRLAAAVTRVWGKLFAGMNPRHSDLRILLRKPRVESAPQRSSVGSVTASSGSHQN